MITITKRAAVLLVSFIIAAFIILIAFSVIAAKEAAGYKYKLEVSYQHSFAELVNGMSEIDSALQKSLYATTPNMICSTCTEVFGKAMMAQMSLGQLPFSDYQLEKTSSFISKVGDYSYTLSRNAAGGSGYTEEEYRNLKKLSEIASVLSLNLFSVSDELNKGVITISELKRTQHKIDERGGSAIPSSLGESFKMIESEFPESPTLIYDGPFSQHLKDRPAVSLEGLSDTDKDLALKAAAEFFGYKNSALKLMGESNGSLPQYCFSLASGRGDLTICVTKKGGKIISMRNPRNVSVTKLSDKEALEAAGNFFRERGFPEMRESYYMRNGNVITVNFAYVQNGVICYPDLAKVSIALDDGSVVGFESAGYIMNHKIRDIPPDVIGEEAAGSKVAKELKVLSHELAVIPSMGSNEVFCHEFKCENPDGKHYIVYVNATTGNLEKILILIEDDNGTLTV